MACPIIQKAYPDGGAAPSSGGAIALKYNTYDVAQTQPPSSSGNATKGNWISVKADVTVHQIAAGMRPLLNAVYHMFIAKEAATAFEVESIIAVSETLPAHRATGAASGYCYFTFATTFDLDAGERYFIGVVRTDGAATAAASCVFSDDAAFESVDIEPEEFSAYVSNVTPAVGFDIPNSGLGFKMPVQVTYARR